MTIFDLVAKFSDTKDANNRALARVVCEAIEEALYVADKAISDVRYRKLLEENRDYYNIVMRKTLVAWMAVDLNSGNTLASMGLAKDSKELFSRYVKGEFNEVLSSVENAREEVTDAELVRLIRLGKNKKTIHDIHMAVNEKESNEVVEDDKVANVEEVEHNDGLQNEQENTESVKKEETTSSDEENIEDIKEEEYVEEETEEDIKEMWSDRVDLEATKIMTVYERLFKAGMELDRPVGVLTSYGYLTINKDNTLKDIRQPVLQPLYSLFQNMLGESLIEAKGDVDIGLSKLINGYTYFTRLQVHNLYGIKEYRDNKKKRFKNWGEFSKELKKTVEKILYKIIKATCEVAEEKIDENLELARKGLTTCIVISEYDIRTCLKMRVYCNNQEINGKLIDSSIKKAQGALFSGVGEVKMCVAEQGVYTINIEFDPDAAGRRPLFAYQAIEVMLERGEKPNWSNLILGRSVKNGTTFTVNMCENTRFNTMIGAGQRAGKGVMTLNILACAFAEKFPVVYLDCKPEMGQMMWELGDKYGVPVASVDGFMAKEGYKLGHNVVEGFGERKALGGALAYLKMLQLGIVIGILRAQSVNFDCEGFDSQKDRVVFVMDEALAVTKLMGSVLEALRKDSKDKDTSEEVKKYAKDVLRWINGMHNRTSSAFLSELPKAKLNMFWLGQSMVAGAWDLKNGDVVSNAVRSANINKLMGNGMQGQYFGLPKGDKLIDNNINATQRCFGLYQGMLAPASGDEVQVFKPYLVLPSVDRSTKTGRDAVEGLDNMPDNVIGFARDAQGNYKEEIGFEGLVSQIAGDAGALKSSLRKSYDMLYTILDKAGLLGKYEGVGYEQKLYEYLYDCELDSLISADDMVDRIQNGGVSSSTEYGDFYDEYEEELEAEIDLGGNSGEEYSKSNGDREYTTEDLMREMGATGDIYEEEKEEYIKPEVQQKVRQEYTEEDLVREMGGMGFSQNTEAVSREAENEESIRGANSEFYSTEEELLDSFIEDAVPEQNINLGEEEVSGANRGNRELTAEEMARIEEAINNMKVIPTQTNTNRKGVVLTSIGKPINKERIIDCTTSGRVRLSWAENFLSRSPMGENIYIEKLWKNILQDVSNPHCGGIQRELITRVGLYSNNLFVNGKIVNLNGVLGGSNCVRLKDIVRFKIMFKELRGIKELYLDADMLTELVGEYESSDLKKVFDSAHNLRVINVIDGCHKETIRKEDVLNNKVSEMAERSELANGMQQLAYESRVQKLNRAWGSATNGSKAWGSKMAVRALQNGAGDVGKGIKKKKGRAGNIIKGALWISSGAVIGAVGSVAWLGWSGAKTLRTLWKGFR